MVPSSADRPTLETAAALQNECSGQLHVRLNAWGKMRRFVGFAVDYDGAALYGLNTEYIKTVHC